MTGKRGRTVPILLTKQMKTSLDLLMKKRNAAGVGSENQFVFACKQSNGHLRGSDTLKKFAATAHLTQPKWITSTALRKQVATMSQLVCLKENELDVLAQYMGHDLRTHRDFYRLPSDTIQLAKISKILLALEKGQLQHYQGKGLDDIEVGSELSSCDSASDSGEFPIVTFCPKTSIW